MSERAYNMKSALPNKVLDEDGNTTDLFGNAVTPTSEAYKNKPSLPNKWLNPDGTYSTLTEIIAGAIDTDVFVMVDELPEEGNPKKIYLVPDGEGGFNEYHYIDGKWDPVGTIDVGVSPQVFYWNGEIDQTGVDFWNNLIPYNHDSALTVIVGRIDDINYVPSIIYVTPNFLIEKSSSVHVYSYRYDDMFNSSSTSVIGIDVMDYTLVFQEDKQIRVIYSLHRSLQREILDTNHNYQKPYTPKYPGSPATKKYVDDSIATNITNVLGGSY